MINWKINYNLKAKYGSKITKYNGHELEVFCDRTGTKWIFVVNGDIIKLKTYATQEEAKQAAIDYVDNNLFPIEDKSND